MKRILALILLLMGPMMIHAQNYQLHTVYMYSFMRYIQWPDKGGADFTIGVLGETAILPQLQKLSEAKKAGDKKIVISRFTSVDDITACKMLFVPQETADMLDAVIEKVGTSSTLIISEGEGQGEKGSNINFVEREGKLVFEMNENAMKRGNFKVSTELSKLAIKI